MADGEWRRQTDRHPPIPSSIVGFDFLALVASGAIRGTGVGMCGVVPRV